MLIKSCKLVTLKYYYKIKHIKYLDSNQMTENVYHPLDLKFKHVTDRSVVLYLTFSLHRSDFIFMNTGKILNNSPLKIFPYDKAQKMSTN